MSRASVIEVPELLTGAAGEDSEAGMQVHIIEPVEGGVSTMHLSRRAPWKIDVGFPEQSLFCPIL